MLRKPRIDSYGTLHFVIVKGTAQGKILCDNTDRDQFQNLLITLLKESDTTCFAWALIPNHSHLLFNRANKSHYCAVMP